MFCDGTQQQQPVEVITLSDSDEDNDKDTNINNRQSNVTSSQYHNRSMPSSTSTATASISIVHERPLSPSAFLPLPRNYQRKAPSQRSSPIIPFSNRLVGGAQVPATISNNIDNSTNQHISLKRRLASSASTSLLQYGQDINQIGAKRPASASLRNDPRSFSFNRSPQSMQNISLNALKILQKSFSNTNAQLLSSTQKHTCLIRGNVDNSNPTNGSSYQILPPAQPVSRDIVTVTNTSSPNRRSSSIHSPYQKQPNHPVAVLSKNTPYSNTSPAITAKNKMTSLLAMKAYNNNNNNNNITDTDNSSNRSSSVSKFLISSKSARTSEGSKMLLSSYCYESFDPKAPPFEPQTFNARFKCSYGSCRKVLSNNVSLMVHVWSHLVYDSDPCDGDDSEYGTNDSDNDYVTNHRQSLTFTCPECLESFVSSHLMQMHYDQVHSDEPADDTCLVCECIVDPVLHAEVHGDDDAPYHCRKCKFRTSIRYNLIQHFIHFHSNTRSLLCPFCLASFHVPSSSSHSNIVTNKPFVDHMRLHAIAKSKKCPNCALRFFREADRRAHKKDHSKKNSKWVSKQCTKHRIRTKGRKVWSSAVKRCCLECNEVVNDIVEHTRQIRTCARCDYATACDTEYMHHKNIKCNIVRFGFTRARLLRHCVVCPKCGRKSANANDIFEHLSKCSDGRALVYESEFKEANEYETQQELNEVEHFSLRQPRRGLVVKKQSLNAFVDKESDVYREPWEISYISEMLAAETNNEHDDCNGDRLGVDKKHFLSFEMEAILEQINDVLKCMDA